LCVLSPLLHRFQWDGFLATGGWNKLSGKSLAFFISSVCDAQFENDRLQVTIIQLLRLIVEVIGIDCEGRSTTHLSACLASIETSPASCAAQAPVRKDRPKPAAGASDTLRLHACGLAELVAALCEVPRRKEAFASKHPTRAGLESSPCSALGDLGFRLRWRLLSFCYSVPRPS
jgi:hypothetical protein